MHTPSARTGLLIKHTDGYMLQRGGVFKGSFKRRRSNPAPTLQERNFKRGCIRNLLFEESAPSKLIHQSQTVTPRRNICKFRLWIICKTELIAAILYLILMKYRDVKYLKLRWDSWIKYVMTNKQTIGISSSGTGRKWSLTVAAVRSVCDLLGERWQVLGHLLLCYCWGASPPLGLCEDEARARWGWWLYKSQSSRGWQRLHILWIKRVLRSGCVCSTPKHQPNTHTCALVNSRFQNDFILGRLQKTLK